MRDFNKVSPAIWLAGSFLSHPQDDRYLYLYLITCPHQNSAGCFTLPDGYACVDLGGWEVGKYRETLKALETTDLITTDPATSEVLINGWFNDNCPMNTNHLTGTKRVINGIKSPVLKKIAQDGLAGAWATFQARRGITQPVLGSGAAHASGGVSAALLETVAARSARG
ncbi:MAG: hypothetical protein WCA78_12225 [Rhizomicrobium sp.]